jgi:hypothetical protein
MLKLLLILTIVIGFTHTAEARHGHHRHHSIHHHRIHSHHKHRSVHRIHAVHRVNAPVTFLEHPSGCPRVAFCGCGASIDALGRNVRRLWLAANWYSFPRSSPGYNTVGVRPHHVLVLKQQVNGTIWMVNDYNSGGHLSRYHAVDISRYTIVNPR